MNLPNLITSLRILLIPFFLFAVLTHHKLGGLIAAVLFVVAAISDGVDGYLARKYKAVTTLGKFLDPLADKLLVTGALVALVELRMISTWVAMVIISREMAVTGLRAIAAADGTVIAAGPWGKAKTVAQISFVISELILHALWPGLWMGQWIKWVVQLLSVPLLWATVTLTIYSGLDYVVAYFRGLKNREAEPARPLRFRWKRRLPSKRRPKP